MARIGVFGAGYVGIVAAACLAELGNDVVVRDVVEEKVERLRRGEVPIFEPGVDDLVARNRERLTFTLDVALAVEGAEFLFVCVDTPPLYSGDADLSRVWTVVDELPGVGGSPVLVMKSTVPVGTGEKVRAALDQRGLTHVGYASNPEFTAEGRAVEDFLHPDRVVIGSFDDEDADRVASLYAAVDGPIVRMDVASAEMVKLASNAFLMTRISFINEIANVCEATGADVVRVAEGVGLDHRLGPYFLRAGVGWGGSCLLGDETVLVRDSRHTRLVDLERLFRETLEGDEIEILSWRPDADGPEFVPVALLTRRQYDGDIVELRTKMGRRVRCTVDHPFVTQAGRKLAGELTSNDWLPVAQGAPPAPRARRRPLSVIGYFEHAGLSAEQVIVRPHRSELLAIDVQELRNTPAVFEHRRGPVARSRDIVRAGALRLHEAAELDVELGDATFGTSTNGTYVPATVVADTSFWRVVGLYIAEGHCATDPRNGHQRLQWCFHPRDEEDLVQEVAGFWRDHGVRAAVHSTPTARVVKVSSRLLAAWWTRGLGLGRNCYEQRVPDEIWDEPEEHKRALLGGLWLGDGSWSYVQGGPSVVLEYGTVSRELADGILRLLSEIGVVARLKVGRTAKSTVDTYWLVISGAEQVERVLDLVPERDRESILESIGRQAKRIGPTGYRRRDNAAWVRVVNVARRPFSGFVYSLEVPPTHTFVTTYGLITSNCFPKDSLALKQLAANSGYHFQLLNAVIEVNELQKRRVIGKLQKHLGRLRGKRIALLGLAFKAGTDDMREAPSLVLASRLMAEGAHVRTWDPVADARRELPQAEHCETIEDAVRGADAAVIVTEWPQLKELGRAEIRDLMARPLIVDGRNLLEPAQARGAGFAYEGIGRPVSPLDVLPETPERDHELEA